MISIITATYDSEKTLSQTIESLLVQTTIDFEYIIIDGYSTDNTVRIIEEYEKKFKIKGIKFIWISEKDCGIYDAWNKGLKLASGQWITFLGSDDVLTSEHSLKISCKHLEKTPAADWAYSKINLINKRGKILRKINERWIWRKFKKHMYVPHAGSFHNKNYFTKYGDFDTQFKIAGDYEMILRKKHKLKTTFINSVTVNMLNEGISNNHIKWALKEESLAKQKNKIRNKIQCKIDENMAYLKHKIRGLIR